MTNSPHQHPEDLKSDLLSRIENLKSRFPDDVDDLDNLLFLIEEDMLGTGKEPTMMKIGGRTLRVKKREASVDAALAIVEAFVQSLEQSTAEQPSQGDIEQKRAAARTHATDVAEPLVAKKEKTYWRDVTVPISVMKHAFADKDFGDAMGELREIIHRGELGTARGFSVEFEDMKLSIRKGESDDAALGKVSAFVKQVMRKYPETFESLGKDPREGMEGSQDRQKIWSQILSHLILLKKKLKGTPLGLQIAELKDLIDGYQLGYVHGCTIRTKEAFLDVKQGDDMNTVVAKLSRFIEDAEREHSSLIKPSERLSAAQVVEEKEGGKTFWVDVVAGLDNVQKVFPQNEYPSIQILKDTIEQNKLGQGTLLITVGPVTLHIDPTDTPKRMKNKVSAFIGSLKQVAPEDDTSMDQTFWRDILARLRAMEETFGDNSDYQMLLMAIETGTLATVKDFKTTIEGVSLAITIKDSDAQMKKKLTTFIDELSKKQGEAISQEALKKAKTRLDNIEEEARKAESQYRRKLSEREQKIADQQEEIRQLKDDLRRARSAPPPSPRSTSVSRSG